MKTSSKTQTFLKSRVFILFILQKYYSLVNLLYKYKKLDINWKKKIIQYVKIKSLVF